MDRRETLRHILDAYRCNPTPGQLEAALDGIEELFNTVPEAKSLEDRKQEFLDSIRPYLDKYGKDMCNQFALYWLERTPNGRKYRFEKEKAFDVPRRLATWAKNNRKFAVVNLLKR